MKIFKLTLKTDLRISIDGVKEDYKKGKTFLTVGLAEFQKFAPYCTSTIITADDGKLLKLIEGNLDKIGATEEKLV